jgi:hypothetical protein
MGRMYLGTIVLIIVASVVELIAAALAIARMVVKTVETAAAEALLVRAR